MTLESLIKKNKFDWVNSDIVSKNFPSQGKVWNMCLVDFKKTVTTEEAIKLLEEQGYRPATVYELLTWSQKNWNGKDLVVALGSVWQNLYGNRFCPYLYRYGSERNLSLYWIDDDFSERCRFAAVRKSLDTPTLGTSEPLDPLVSISLPYSIVEALKKAL